MTYTTPGEAGFRAALPFHSTFDSIACANPQSQPASGAWPSANLGIFVPWTVAGATWVRRTWFISGNTTGNVDVGVYRADGTRLVSSGAQSIGSSNTLILTDVTDTLLVPGDYYIGISCSSTANILRSAGAGWTRMWGVCEMSSAHPLPATATFAAPTYEYIPFVGISTISGPP